MGSPPGSELQGVDVTEQTVRMPVARRIPASFEATKGSAAGAQVSTLGARSMCSGCPLRHVCLPQGLPEAAARALDQLLIGKRRVRAGQDLVRQGDTFQWLYAVRFGSFKTSLALRNGREQVTGFSFSGDLIGFDGFATSEHACTATALEDSEVCSIPIDALLALPGDEKGHLRRRVHQMISAEMLREQYLMTLVANTQSEPRVAAFLVLLSRRMRERGYSGVEFNLRMSRADIGSYMGLTLETVSRTLSSFADRGWIEVRKKKIHLLQLHKLAGLCEEALPGVCDSFAGREVEQLACA